MTTSDIDSIIKALTTKDVTASTLADETSPCVISNFLSTGTYVLDAIMGGGLPVGRIVEIYGDTSTGKSLIAAQACASVQDDGGLAVYVDTETAVSLPIMEAVGIDTASLIYLAPDTVEQVFRAMETAIEEKPTDKPMLIVWDSIAATSARAEMDKSTGETGYLTHARVISQGLRKFTRRLSKAQVAVLFLNQSKENIGVMFGDKVATFGGKAVGFHSSVRVQVSVASKLKDSRKRTIGIVIRAKVVKNKVAPPFREASLPVYFGYGIEDSEAALYYLRDAKVAKVGGGWWDIDLGKEPFRFRKAGWGDLYDKHYNIVRDLIDSVMKDEDLI